jgi:AcrR family transcriptional regulator
MKIGYPEQDGADGWEQHRRDHGGVQHRAGPIRDPKMANGFRHRISFWTMPLAVSTGMSDIIIRKNRPQSTIRNRKMTVTRHTSKIVRNDSAPETDRRAARSKRLIQSALMELLHTRRFDSITVKDIIDRAGVGRSTFYAHFLDKEDLVTKFFEGMLEEQTRGTYPDEGSGSATLPLAAMLEGLKAQVEGRSIWVDNRCRDFLFSVGQAYWVRRIEKELAERMPPGRTPRVPLPVISRLAAGAASALIFWWLKNGMPYSPAEMQSMFDAVLQPGILAALR